MVKLNIELDDETFAALLRAAEQSGMDVQRLRDAAILANEQQTSTIREFDSWDEFFKWGESLNIVLKDKLATRDEIYAR